MNDFENRTIVLMTDFGHQDDYAGLMKGVLVSNCNHPTIVDLSHDIPPGNIEVAAFILMHDFSYFPENSIYINVVDPGVGTKRDILVAEIGERVFIAPDNGLLFPILEQNNIKSAWFLKRDRMEDVGKTFHGRDVMAPLAAAIHKDGLNKLSLIKKNQWSKLEDFFAVDYGDEIQGKIIHIDHYGNLITNITINKRVIGKIIFGRLELNKIDTFEEGEVGSVHYLIGSKNTVEIVEKNGSAQERMQAVQGDKVTWKRIDR